MPLSLYASLRYRTASMGFMDEAVYVWGTTSMALKHEQLADLSATIFAEALYHQRQLFADLTTPLTKLVLGIGTVIVDASGTSRLTGGFKMIEGALWSERECHEPSPLARFDLVCGTSGPYARTVLTARRALPTGDVSIEKERDRSWLDAAARSRNAIWSEPTRNRHVRIVPKPAEPLSKLEGDHTECP